MRLSRTVIMGATRRAPRQRSSGWTSLPHVRVLAVALAVAALALGLALGPRGGAGDGSSTPVGLESLLRTAAPLVVFSEFGQTADTIWAADPDDPAERARLAVVEHAYVYGISPSLSPDGAHLAYTVLPPHAGQLGPDAPAELWLLETATGVTLRLAEGLDLLVAPVWTPAGDAVVVRASDGREGIDGSTQLLRIDLSGAATPVVEASAALFPIDLSPDGAWLYYAVLSPGGTDLARAPVSGGGEMETVAHLSDGFARDWHLSPDGARLAYLAEASGDAGMAFEARVLELSTGEVRTPLTAAAASHFSPVWEGDGGLTIGQLTGSGGSGGAPVRLNADGSAAVSALPGPAGASTGFDVPLAWSPDGVHLAVRSFEGASVAAPGPSRVVLVSGDGERRALSELSDVVVAGWLQASD
jgi:Tol biopolymer transport system component